MHVPARRYVGVAAWMVAACCLFSPHAIAQSASNECFACPCSGGVTSLTMRYNGPNGAHVTVDDNGNIIFDAILNDGNTFTVTGGDVNGKFFTNNVIFSADGQATVIHVSCSQPIGVGLVFGPFTVIGFTSLDGGTFNSPCDNCPCDGTYTGLTKNDLGDLCQASLQPPTEGGAPALFTMTARTSINPGSPTDPVAAGSTGAVAISKDGAGVKIASCSGGSKEISGKGGDEDEELVFTLNAPTDVSRIVIGLRKIRFADNSSQTETAIAEAGVDQAVYEQVAVALDATGSTIPSAGGQLNYLWTQVAGPPVTLSDPTAAQPTFAAPAVAQPTGLEFHLDVSYGQTVVADTVLITINEQAAGNNLPIADAGPNRIAEGLTAVFLDAAGSSDPDGDLLTYSWSQVAGPPVILIDGDTSQAKFLAPYVPEQGELTFRVTVTDGASVSTSTVNTIVSSSNDEPVIFLSSDGSAGFDHTILTSEIKAAFTGTGSDRGIVDFGAFTSLPAGLLIDAFKVRETMDHILVSFVLECEPDCVTNADCDDGDACNGSETCDPFSGCQAGAAPNCDDGNACTTDSCDTATGCVNTDITASCNDNNACTADSCDTATGCVNTDITASCNDNNACTADSCDTATGCINTDITASCNDNNACTTDSCDTATGCVNTDITASCNDNNACTTDSCDQTTGCVNTDISATCVDSVPCTVDSCDPASGCVNTPSDPACDDTNACTSDTCDAQTGCVNTDISSSCDDGVVCTTDSCLPATGCVNTNIPGCCFNDGDCNDTDVCTTDVCNTLDGTCTNMITLNCDDNNACTTDSCNPATGCVNTDISASCNDNDACTADTCDTLTGCVNTDISASCNDNDACTADTCVPATGCVFTDISPSCNDNNACTADSCDTLSGCVNTDISSSCNDNDVCTGVETCDTVTGCQPGSPLVCNDNNACTADTCDSISGCVFTDISASCDDNNVCTGTETCNPQTGCVDGDPLICNDNELCTDDGCDPVTGCTFVPNNANSCEVDGSLCTVDTCVGGVCVTDNVTCDPDEDCLTFACDPTTGVCESQAINEGLGCTDDGLECTDDICLSGVCEHIATPGDICTNDGIECTSDVCDATGACTHPGLTDGIECTNEGIVCSLDVCVDGICEHLPMDDFCDDGAFCNGDEVCDLVQDCVFGPDSCPGLTCCEDSDTCVTDCCSDADCPDDGETCTDEACQNGVCVAIPNDTNTCTDGNPCTDDACVGGVCIGTPIVCDDGDLCTTDECVNGNCIFTPFVPTPTSCGQDECASTGELICVNGEFVDTCTLPPGCEHKIVLGGGGTVAPGETVTVTIDLENVPEPLIGVNVLISYDTTFIALVNIVPADLVAAGILTPPAVGWGLVEPITDIGGDVRISVEIIGGSISGTNVPVATLTFTALLEGTTDVVFLQDNPPSFPLATAGCITVDGRTIFPTKVEEAVVIIAERGACCVGEGACFNNLTTAECLAVDGEFRGVDSACVINPFGGDDFCPGTIPAVSEWGLIVLALLLMTAGKLYFGRRGTASA